jgi:hypothetical protein
LKQQGTAAVSSLRIGEFARRAGCWHASTEQLQAIVVGLPCERLDERAKIRVL